MTEERFEFREVNNGGITPKVWDNKKQKYSNLLECVDLLNDQHEEKEQLKQENNELKADNKRMVKFIMSKGYTLKDYLDWLKDVVWK